MANNYQATIIQAEVQCLCGSANFMTDIHRSTLPIKAHLCHCNICRRTHGALHTYHAPWPVEKPVILEKLKAYRSSRKVVRYFCPVCGAHMLDHGDETGVYMISTSLVKQAADLFVFDEHYFVEDTVDGGFSDLLPVWGNEPLKRFATGSASGELGLFWNRSEKSVSSLNSSSTPDKLFCHCHCRGVEFYISRPKPGYTVHDPQDKFGGQFDPEDGKWPAANCVCNDCRLASAADLVPWIFVQPSSISKSGGTAIPDPPRFGTLIEHHSSEGVRRYFCGTCGATVFFDSLERPEVIDVALGVADAVSGARAEEWLAWDWSEPGFGECAANSKMYQGILEGYRRWNERSGGKTLD